jgi:hypothetical protein
LKYCESDDQKETLKAATDLNSLSSCSITLDAQTQEPIVLQLIIQSEGGEGGGGFPACIVGRDGDASLEQLLR